MLICDFIEAPIVFMAERLFPKTVRSRRLGVDTKGLEGYLQFTNELFSGNMDYPEIFEDMARSWGCKKNNILWNECRVSSEMLIDAANKSMEDQDRIFYKALGHLLHIDDVPYSDGDDLKSNS
jgi:hypothetical protein